MSSAAPRGMTPIDEALMQLLHSTRLLVDAEAVPLLEANGRFLAEDIVAALDVPGYDNSAMDGFAVNAAELGAGRSTFVISQRIAAGATGSKLEIGTAARIFTGAPLPEGADAVVMQENCRVEDSRLTVLEKVVAGDNVRARGDDIAAGKLLLTGGRRLGPADIGLLAAIGLSTISVRRPLRVALMTTGDELIKPGTALQPGQIYNSNFYALSALLQNLGVTVIDCGCIEDSLAATKQALLHAVQMSDCIVSSGGVSVGEEDHVKSAVEALGKLSLWKLAIKPGKPFAYGQVQGKAFFGLPGNPVSAFVTFLLVVRPCLLKSMGASKLHAQEYLLPAGFALPESGIRQEYLRVSVSDTDSAQPVLLPFSNQSSGVMTSVSQTDGLTIVPPYTAVAVGDMLRYLPFNEIIR
jgi:molybdopterin molybdotransferase